jgi:hypothetical protein
MLAFALLAIDATACAVAFAYAAMLTGRLLVSGLRQAQQALAWNLLEGIGTLGQIGFLRILGGLVLFVATMIGLGAFAASVAATYRATAAPLTSIPSTPPGNQQRLVAA